MANWLFVTFNSDLNRTFFVQIFEQSRDLAHVLYPVINAVHLHEKKKRNLEFFSNSNF